MQAEVVVVLPIFRNLMHIPILPSPLDNSVSSTYRFHSMAGCVEKLAILSGGSLFSILSVFVAECSCSAALGLNVITEIPYMLPDKYILVSQQLVCL